MCKRSLYNVVNMRCGNMSQPQEDMIKVLHLILDNAILLISDYLTYTT
jgi:hypothetical protein